MKTDGLRKEDNIFVVVVYSRTQKYKYESENEHVMFPLRVNGQEAGATEAPF